VDAILQISFYCKYIYLADLYHLSPIKRNAVTIRSSSSKKLIMPEKGQDSQ
jgi:hypothetical protein